MNSADIQHDGERTVRLVLTADLYQQLAAMAKAQRRTVPEQLRVLIAAGSVSSVATP